MMINFLSYVGMNIQSEVCLWTLLGLLCTIFDATLFKVNANLKQVWQMSMPVEISMPVQKLLRTMISGVMLVQCFTVYVYIAAYIVLLYPAFLEERPILVLPWLLLAAVRKLLCELLSLALGLGTCLLVGAARPPCIKFVVTKIVSIMPSVYMWILVLSYYNTLKVASVFQQFPTSLPTNDLDYGLELAIRRRCTKSLLGEAQLRSRLLSDWYVERPQSLGAPTLTRPVNNVDLPSTANTNGSTVDLTEQKPDADMFEENKFSITGTYEDLCGHEITVPRNTDRISEQFVLMLLRISTYIKKAKYDDIKIFESRQTLLTRSINLSLETCPAQAEDNPPLVGSSKESTASYLKLYPQIFMKGICDRNYENIKTAHSSIWYKFNETTITERETVESVDNRKSSILLKEKATNSTCLNNVEKIDGEQKTNDRFNDATQQQQLKNELEKSISHNELKIISHHSVGSDDSLRSLLAKMQIHLSEIIAIRDVILYNNDSRRSLNSSHVGSRTSLEKNSENKNCSSKK